MQDGDEDPKIQRYLTVRRDLKPSAIERMEFSSRSEAGTGPVLTLILRPLGHGDERRVRLVFDNVGDLSFGPGVFTPYLSLLEILSIRDRQWEGLNYRVVNDEQDNGLRFYCCDFDMTIMVDAANSQD